MPRCEGDDGVCRVSCRDHGGGTLHQPAMRTAPGTLGLHSAPLPSWHTAQDTARYQLRGKRHDSRRRHFFGGYHGRRSGQPVERHVLIEWQLGQKPCCRRLSEPAGRRLPPSRAAGRHTQHGAQYCFRNSIQHAICELVFTRMIPCSTVRTGGMYGPADNVPRLLCQVGIYLARWYDSHLFFDEVILQKGP